MKAHYRTASGRLVFELQGETVKDLFRQIAQTQEVFEAAQACGLCGNTEIRYQVRTIDDNDFYELVCMQCRAQLHFGQHKKGGTLFVKRRDDHGALLPATGWQEWKPKQRGAA
jgi:hypothetical protein